MIFEFAVVDFSLLVCVQTVCVCVCVWSQLDKHYRKFVALFHFYFKLFVWYHFTLRHSYML